MHQQGPICVFANAPEAGNVKTRLGPVVGIDGASELAKAFPHDTWAAASGLPWAKPVIAATAASPVYSELGTPEVWPQGEGDLGARLERVLGRALKAFPFAIAIGSDTPGLPRRFLEQAFSALVEADAVISPCADGGFYLIGLRRCPRGLLAGIPWSENDTFSRTLANLKAAGMDVRALDEWFDIDRPQDLRKLGVMIAAGELSAPRTKETLERLATRASIFPPVTFSAIIPVLNEHECLPRALTALLGQEWIGEVIIVDGGSTDGRLEWARLQSGVNLVESVALRGIRLNAGVKAANGEALIFLHADTRLPRDACDQLRLALESPRAAGGCFCVRFNTRRPRSLGIVAAGINLRTRLTRAATRDQAIFARGDVFEQVGGFPEWPLFEDVEFVTRVKRAGKFAVIRNPVTVSARRHGRCGVLRRVLLCYLLRLGFWAGISPFKLAECYHNRREEHNLALSLQPPAIRTIRQR